MSKKETEFDRFERMKRMERESEVQRRKNNDADDFNETKKGGKSKLITEPSRKNRSKAHVRDIELDIEEEYDYV